MSCCVLLYSVVSCRVLCLVVSCRVLLCLAVMINVSHVLVKQMRTVNGDLLCLVVYCCIVLCLVVSCCVLLCLVVPRETNANSYWGREHKSLFFTDA